jgi:hypothetical protein
VLVPKKYEYSPRRMRELRKKKYPHFETWCVALGRGWRSVQMYEGERPPPVHVLVRAAELLNVHPGKFFVEVDE